MSTPIKLAFLVFGLIVAYGIAWSYSTKGWGYAGYGTERDENGNYYGTRGPSIFYFGGASYFPSSSVRRDGLSGPGSTGRGPGMGK